MKKFMKVCAITAVILIGVGLIITYAAGAAVGGRMVSDVLKTTTDGLVDFRYTDGEFGIFVNEKEVELVKEIGKNIVVNEDDGEIDIEVDFDSAYDIFRGDVEKYEVAEDVIDLKIMAGGCRLRMMPSEDDSFYAEAEDVDKFQCYSEDDCLYVKSSKNISTWNDSDSGVIILYVPEDYSFENVEMELGAGQLVVENVSAQTVDLEVGAGQIEVNALQADECDIEVGLGEATVKDAQVNNVDVRVGMGTLKWEGAVSERINGKCSMGEIEMLLSGSEEDYDYKVSVAAGNVTIGSRNYSGVGQKGTINNHADKKVVLDCAMGDIKVDFED